MGSVSEIRLLDPEVEADIRQRRRNKESLASIAERYGVSRQRIHAVLTRPNPRGKPVEYRCKQCGKRWKTTAQYLPERCGAEGGCGSYKWDED